MKCQHQKACLLQKISYGMVVHVFGIDNGSKAFVRSLILCQKWMIYCRADLNPILGMRGCLFAGKGYLGILVPPGCASVYKPWGSNKAEKQGQRRAWLSR
eukprot:scaffold216225_cov17-Tisochrysis_lutea.AAC.1